ncbi:MAG: hypothetical protein ACLPV4_11660 [Solirubrobacteraceae bacterium]
MSCARTEVMVNRKGCSVRIALAAVTYGIAIGACGSSSKANPNASVSAPGIKYAGCMRAHDVTNFPDPSAGGGGVQIGGSGSIRRRPPS